MTLTKSKILPISSSKYLVNATGSPPFWPRLSEGYLYVQKDLIHLQYPIPKIQTIGNTLTKVFSKCHGLHHFGLGYS
jgi:hypothetical protein